MGWRKNNCHPQIPKNPYNVNFSDFGLTGRSWYLLAFSFRVAYFFKSNAFSMMMISTIAQGLDHEHT